MIRLLKNFTIDLTRVKSRLVKVKAINHKARYGSAGDAARLVADEVVVE
jgi:hypothetical protein